MASKHDQTPETVNKLKEIYPDSNVSIDVSVDTNLIAEYTVSQNVGRDLAFKRVDDIYNAKVVIRQLLQYQIGGYSPVLITPFNTERYTNDGSIEQEIISICSDAEVCVLAIDGDHVDYILHPQ